MRFLLTIAPLALLSTACSFRTPANALDYEDDAPIATLTRTLPSAADAIAAWQLPLESPWSRYEKVTLLSSLEDQPVTATIVDVNALDIVPRAKRAAERLAMVGLPPGVLWVVDLPGAGSVAFGATLSQRAASPVAPVMTFNNWPAENEAIPAEQALSALVTMQPRRLGPADVTATPVFLLDAYRLAAPYLEPDPSELDNRYRLFPSDFPEAAVLRAQGINEVVYVVETRAERSTEEDDFHAIAMAYEEAGIALRLVDLAQLERLDAVPSWNTTFAAFQLQLRPRATIFDDPAFYSHAHGGFGVLGTSATGAAGLRAYRASHPTVFGRHSGARHYSNASPHVFSVHSSGHHGGGHSSGHHGGGHSSG